MSDLLRIVVSVVGILTAGVSSCCFLHFHSQRWIFLMLPKMVANSLAPYIVVIAAVTAILGGILWAPLGIVSGCASVLILLVYVARVTAEHAGFEMAFGPGWLDTLSPEQRQRLPRSRWALRPSPAPGVRCERNITFWTISENRRQLLCDIWQPPQGLPPSGLALIYLHTGEWHFADKDFGTRPLFRHLAGQGHVVMDVAYRLCPEVNLYGMIGDVKRAVAWMKTNAAQFAVDPGQIVLSGGSAGGHLALLAAYTCDCPEWTPDELKSANLRVKAVVSYYGPPDLHAFFEEGYGRVNPPKKVTEIAGHLLNGSSEVSPELYQKGSPVTYVKAGCPPTLIFQGEHDCGVPVRSTRDLHHKLVQAGVPVVYVEFPQTEHGFDLQIKAICAIAKKQLHWSRTVNSLEDLSQYSPAAQAARYDLDRFLALMSA